MVPASRVIVSGPSPWRGLQARGFEVQVDQSLVDPVYEPAPWVKAEMMTDI